MKKNKHIAPIISSLIEDLVGAENTQIFLDIAISNLLNQVKDNAVALHQLKEKIETIKKNKLYIAMWDKIAVSNCD